MVPGSVCHIDTSRWITQRVLSLDPYLHGMEPIHCPIVERGATARPEAHSGKSYECTSIQEFIIAQHEL